MPGGPDPTNAWLMQALALVQHRPADAERMAGDVLKKHPRHARAQHVMGCALLVQGRFEDAIAPLREAARLHHDPEIDTQLAIALRRTGRTDDALSRLKRAIKRQPPYAGAFLEMAHVLRSAERHGEAIDVLRQGVAIAPMSTALSVELGQVLLARGDRAGARAAFMHALSIAPDAVDALFGLGRTLAAEGAHGAAADAFRRSLLCRPGYTPALLNLGQCLLALGDLDAGYDCFRRAARNDAALQGQSLMSLVKSSRGRFWLKPSDAARFFA